MLTREQKKKVVEDLTQNLKEAKSVVFSDFQGLAAKDIQDVRVKLRVSGIWHKVVKLTLIKKALAAAGIDASKFNFQVPVAVSLSREDETAAAKILNEFGKTHTQLKVLAGILNNKFLDLAEVKTLAALPGKQELLGQLVLVIASPLRGIVNVLTGNMRDLIKVLTVVKESRQAL